MRVDLLRFRASRPAYFFLGLLSVCVCMCGLDGGIELEMQEGKEGQSGRVSEGISQSQSLSRPSLFFSLLFSSTSHTHKHIQGFDLSHHTITW